jgi:hypothetical protein
MVVNRLGAFSGVCESAPTEFVEVVVRYRHGGDDLKEISAIDFLTFCACNVVAGIDAAGTRPGRSRDVIHATAPRFESDEFESAFVFQCDLAAWKAAHPRSQAE